MKSSKTKEINHSGTIPLPSKSAMKNFLSPENLTLFYVVLLGIIFVLAYTYVFDNKIFLGGDNAVYYITGKALAEGKGYTNIHLSEQSPANHFPPGYPFIISLVIRFFGDDTAALKRTNGAFFFATIMLLFALIKELTGKTNLAFVVALITLLNAHLLQYSFIEMSEIPYAFFILLSLWCFIKTLNAEASLKNPYFWLLMASIIAAFYIKSLGITLLFAAILVLAFHKRWEQIIILAICFLFAYAPWYIRSEKLGGNTYAKQIMMMNPYRPELGTVNAKDFPLRFLKNAKRYLSKEINSAYSGSTINYYQTPSTWKDYTLGIILILLVLFGLLSLERFKLFLFIFLSNSLFFLMLWPSIWVSVRFMLPFLPILLFLSINGSIFLLEKILRKLNKDKPSVNVSPYLFLLIIPFTFSNISILHANVNEPYEENFSSYFELAKWCKTNLPDSANICTRKPELFYLFSQRKGSSYPYLENTDSLFAYLKKKHITHVVIDKLGFSSNDRYLIPAIDNNLEKFKRIKSVNGTWLIQAYFDDAFGYVGERDTLGRKNGRGVSHYCGGSIYEGTYFANKREGSGKYIYPTGNYYVGEFRNDHRDGTGTLYFKEGGNFTGNWKDDVPKGFGIQYDNDGKIVNKGLWEGNKLVEKMK